VVVGRRAELEQLRRLIAAAAMGEGSCTLLTGEGGVGKTRLLNEVILEGRRRGLAVLVGRASIGAPVSFGTIAEALRSHLRGSPTVAGDPVYDPGLRLILPEWPAPPSSGGLSHSQLRLLAHEGLVALVRGLVGGGGGLLVIDDLHDADPESVEALRYLIHASLPGLAVVAASRTHESPLADRLIDTLYRQGLAEPWPMDGLDGADVADLIAAILGARPPEALVADVVARTDGVPLLVEEVLDAHVRAGSLVTDDVEAVWHGGADVVPRSVAALVTSRLDRFSQASRDVLIAGSVVGLGDERLVAAASEQTVHEIRSTLRAAVEAGLVESISGVLAFRHAVVRDAVHDHAPPDDVRVFHQRAAAALASSSEEAALESRAIHLFAAGEEDAAAAALVDAAASAQRGHALLRAEALAGQAQQWASSIRLVDLADDAMASALSAQGRWAEALTIDNLTVARAGHAPGRWMRMAQCALDGRLLDVARALAADATAIADDSPFVAITIGRLASVDGDAERALACAQRALDQAGSDPLTACAALDLQARTFEFLGQRADAAAAWSAGAQRAAAAGLTAERLRHLLSLAELELFAGQRPQRMREVVDVAHSVGAIVEEAWGLFNLSIVLVMQGDPAAACTAAERAVGLCRGHHLDLLPYALMSYAGTLARLGEPGFEQILDEAQTMAGDTVDAAIHGHGIRGDHLLILGRYEEALPHLEAVTEAIVAAPGGLPSSAPYWLAIALRAVGRDSDARDAFAVAQGLPSLLRWHGTPLVRDVAAALLDGDEHGVDAALASTAGGSAVFEIALLHVLAAEILTSPERARWLRTALDLYEGSTGTLGVDRVRGLLRAAGGALPRRRRARLVPPDLLRVGITPREAEVLDLVAGGMTNAAIADKLVLSVRTVESHVSALLAKLAVDSRSELARHSSDH
jgi:DNA-binding NarL/FixJ family response regulator/tetratricopeptide (TPR) repeat protein